MLPPWCSTTYGLLAPVSWYYVGWVRGNWLVRILPMYAGGRWEEYGAKPLVYTSIDKSCAGRYPFASLTAVTTYVAEL